MKSIVSLWACVTTLLITLTTGHGQDRTSYAFSFGGKLLPGYVYVTPMDYYSDAAGYGFEPGADVVETNGCVSSTSPFYFSAKLPEGNYKVTVTLGDKLGTSATTVKAELRRLMLYHIQTKIGEIATYSFIVNLRRPEISGDGQVHLKTREKTTEWRDWDDKLTLEFDDTRPCVRALTIQKVDVPTIFILGDSTVCDQPAEPWDSWGQMLPVFFKPAIAIANHAESGETIADSIAGGRFKKVFSLMKPGDYLLIQFGHNDMKSKRPNALELYKTNLVSVIAETRAKGGTPVLVTSMERKAGIERPTLEGYPEAAREIAQQEKCALIDLNAMSVVFYKALGTNLDKAFVDGTHHDNYGSYELAKCVMQGLLQIRLPVVKYIVTGFKGFDPAHPDPVDTFYMPASLQKSDIKPLGN